MRLLPLSVAPSATELIRMDHARVVAAFHRYKEGASPRVRQGIAETVSLLLEIHAQLEEEIFYPALREVDERLVDRSYPEHEEMRRLIRRLRGLEPSSPEYDSTFMTLMRTVLHHVADEETTLLPDAERLLSGELPRLGARMAKRRLELGAPRRQELGRSLARMIPPTTVLVAAGALLAGALALRRVRRAA